MQCRLHDKKFDFSALTFLKQVTAKKPEQFKWYLKQLNQNFKAQSESLGEDCDLLVQHKHAHRIKSHIYMCMIVACLQSTSNSYFCSVLSDLSTLCVHIPVSAKMCQFFELAAILQVTQLADLLRREVVISTKSYCSSRESERG